MCHPNHALITGWSWHAKSIPSCGLQNWEGFSCFSCSVPWGHLLPDLVEKCRGRRLAERDNRIKTAWSDKQCFCKDSHLGHTMMCSLKHSVQCQMWGEVLSPVDSEWFLGYLIDSEIPYFPLPPKKGQLGRLRRRPASQSNPFAFQQPAMEDKMSIFLFSILVLCNGMLAWACSDVTRPDPTCLFRWGK